MQARFICQCPYSFPSQSNRPALLLPLCLHADHFRCFLWCEKSCGRGMDGNVVLLYIPLGYACGTVRYSLSFCAFAFFSGASLWAMEEGFWSWQAFNHLIFHGPFADTDRTSLRILHPYASPAQSTSHPPQAILRLLFYTLDPQRRTMTSMRRHMRFWITPRNLACGNKIMGIRDRKQWPQALCSVEESYHFKTSFVFGSVRT